MFEHYLAALLSLGQAKDLAYSALPDAPVQPRHEASLAAGPNGSSPKETA
jgi:hypothetical protein